jgi:hypothetical protein
MTPNADAQRARGLATWAGPAKQAFEVSKDYKLICGLSIGDASGQAVNQYNPDGAR